MQETINNDARRAIGAVKAILADVNADTTFGGMARALTRQGIPAPSNEIWNASDVCRLLAAIDDD